MWQGLLSPMTLGGETIPPMAAIDKHGQPTTDPAAGLEGAQLPMAGHKGTSLALMVELLAASFTGDAFAYEAAEEDSATPTQHGEMIIAIDPERCTAGGGRDAFLNRVEALFKMVETEAKTAEAEGRSMRLPSQRRWAARKRAQEGFEIDEALLNRCRALAAKFWPPKPLVKHQVGNVATFTMGRRRFAKKGEDVRHFKLVARPGADDGDDQAPLILEPYAPPGVLRRTGKTEAELLSMPESLQHLGSAIFQPGQEELQLPRTADSGDAHEAWVACSRNCSDFWTVLKRQDVEWGDLDGDCYFPPDGYNYEQHLKSVSGAKKAKSVVGVVLEAPEPVREEDFFKQHATNNDEEEVLRALENDEEYEELEENEIDDVLDGGVLEPETLLWGPVDNDHPDMAVFAEHKALLKARGLEEEDDDFDDGLDEFDGGATGSYAKPKDEDFEHFLADQYADDEIGARDEEITKIHVSSMRREPATFWSRKRLKETLCWMMTFWTST
eukprot:symbB.v1.2.014758.t1/scaffold1081.1/size139474/15